MEKTITFPAFRVIFTIHLLDLWTMKFTANTRIRTYIFSAAPTTTLPNIGNYFRVQCSVGPLDSHDSLHLLDLLQNGYRGQQIRGDVDNLRESFQPKTITLCGS